MADRRGAVIGIAAFLTALLYPGEGMAGAPFVECRMPSANLPEVEEAYAACPDCVPGYDPAPEWIIRCARDEFKQRNYCLMQQSGADHRRNGLSFYRDESGTAFVVVGASLLMGSAKVALQVDGHPPSETPSRERLSLDAASPVLAQMRGGSRIETSITTSGQAPAARATLSIAGFGAAYDKMADAVTDDRDRWTACAERRSLGQCCGPTP